MVKLAKSRYARKRAQTGGDYYGDWTNGRQTVAERVNGHVLRYDNGEWK